MPGPSSGKILSTVITDEDDLPDSSSQDRGLEEQKLDGQDYVEPGQEDRRQEDDTAGSPPGLASVRGCS